MRCICFRTHHHAHRGQRDRVEVRVRPRVVAEFLPRREQPRADLGVLRELLAGPRLFAFACEAMRAGIRAQHPDASPDQVEQLLRQRLDLARRKEAPPHD